MKFLSRKNLKTILSYSKTTGLFTWLESRGRTKKGNIAGSKAKTGYLKIRINGNEYLAHRLAFFYTFGFWPKQIDHINGVRTDNRIKNLRGATSKDNNRNRSLSPNSKSGVIGVNWCSRLKKWVARIKVDGKNIYLGSSKSIKEVKKKRKEAEIKHGFHKGHGKPQVTHA